MLAVDVEGSPELKHLIGRRKYWVKWEGDDTMATIEGMDELEVIPSV